jgi:hypothetical protein
MKRAPFPRLPQNQAETNRQCHVCGRTYLRRNLSITWIKHANGVWVKQLLKVCTYCGDANFVRKILGVAHVLKPAARPGDE